MLWKRILTKTLILPQPSVTDRRRGVEGSDKRVLLPEKIVKAHEDGVLHFHDMDYYLQSIFNCCLINIGDMFEHGTVMNGKLIESPKSFQVACTVMTQIISAVASSQYGGQSVDVRHLGKYLRMTVKSMRDITRKNMEIKCLQRCVRRLQMIELQMS